ncbi:MAG: hypothetical protein [Sthenivirus nowtis]|uniref:Uncharacterized protein n=1 Tax=Cressdnaviricota sp. TaxID=2748378 RepID=A0A345MY60_9VIRU|nr:MAG: hypothetical protein [Cressdnaviricota sp.]
MAKTSRFPPWYVPDEEDDVPPYMYRKALLRKAPLKAPVVKRRSGRRADYMDIDRSRGLKQKLTLQELRSPKIRKTYFGKEIAPRQALALTRRPVKMPPLAIKAPAPVPVQRQLFKARVPRSLGAAPMAITDVYGRDKRDQQMFDSLAKRLFTERPSILQTKRKMLTSEKPRAISYATPQDVSHISFPTFEEMKRSGSRFTEYKPKAPLKLSLRKDTSKVGKKKPKKNTEGFLTTIMNQASAFLPQLVQSAAQLPDAFDNSTLVLSTPKVGEQRRLTDAMEPDQDRIMPEEVSKALAPNQPSRSDFYKKSV